MENSYLKSPNFVTSLPWKINTSVSAVFEISYPNFLQFTRFRPPHMTSVPDVSGQAFLSQWSIGSCAEPAFCQNAHSVHSGTWGSVAPEEGSVQTFLAAGPSTLAVAARLDRLALRAVAFSATTAIVATSFKVSMS